MEPIVAAEDLRDQVRRFLDEHVPAEAVDAWERDQSTPRSLIRRLGEMGMCRYTVPVEYGGTGREIAKTLVVVEELARRSHSLAGLYWSHVAYCGLTITATGTAEQKARLLPAAARGDVLFAYGLSEPDVGADLAAVATTAERLADKVIVKGRKRWTSNADASDYVYALVRTGPVEDKRRNLTFVLVPTAAPGVRIDKIDTMGDRGVGICEVEFDDVELSLDDVVGGPDAWNNGWAVLTGATLEVEKLGVPAMCLGIAEAAVDEAWRYSQERVQGGKRICGHQSIRHALVEAQTRLQACRLMVHHAGALVEAGRPAAVETSMAKLFVADTAKEIVLACQEVVGAPGLARGLGLRMERYVRDVIGLPIIGGSSAIQRNNIASLMGLPRE
ncbi:MAG: acyl-CoA dehydrogenase family protein [Acidimicrobiia bacterium]